MFLAKHFLFSGDLCDLEFNFDKLNISNSASNTNLDGLKLKNDSASRPNCKTDNNVDRHFVQVEHLTAWQTNSYSPNSKEFTKEDGNAVFVYERRAGENMPSQKCSISGTITDEDLQHKIKAPKKDMETEFCESFVGGQQNYAKVSKVRTMRMQKISLESEVPRNARNHRNILYSKSFYGDNTKKCFSTQVKEMSNLTNTSNKKVVIDPNKDGPHLKESCMPDLESQMTQLNLGEEVKSIKLEKLPEIIQCCRDACRDVSLVDALEICEDLLKMVASNTRIRVASGQIRTEMTNIITSAVKKEFKHWDITAQAKEGIQLMALMREVLMLLPQPLSEGAKVNVNVFNKIIHKIIMPKIQNGIHSWDVRCPEQMLTFINHWNAILTLEMMGFVEDCVCCRLEVTIMEWDPFHERTSIESWINPWVQILGAKIESLYLIIAHHLEEALAIAEPRDVTPLIMKKLGLFFLDEKTVLKIFANNIVPKLAEHVICIPPQDFPSLKHVADWSEYVPAKSIVELLEKHFFPKIIETIVTHIRLETFEAAHMGLWVATCLKSIPRGIKSITSIKQCICDIMTLVTHGMIPRPKVPGLQ